MRLLKQSSTAQTLPFLMVLTSDHITGATGLTPTVTLSKNGGAFASPSGAVSEIANGWYQVAGNATDTGTLGPLVLHATGTAADPCDVIHEVVAFDPQNANSLGLAYLTGDIYGYLTTNLGALGANATAIASAVWSAATRVLTAGTNVVLAKGTGVTGFNDIAATAIVSGGAITTSSGKVSEVSLVDTLTTYTGNTPQTGDAYSYLTANLGALGANLTALPALVWNALTSGMTTLGSIGKLLATYTAAPTAAAIATAVLTDTSDNTTAGSLGYLSAQNLDAKVSSRSTYSGTDTSGTTTLLGRLTSTRAGLLDNLDTNVGSRLAATSYTAPDNADVASILAAVSDGTHGNAALLTAIDAIPTMATLAASQPNYAPAKASDVTTSQGVITTALAALQSHGDAHWQGSDGGDATLANQEAILAKLTGATVKILSPLAMDQSLTLVAGDDYFAADGRAPSWSILNYTGPDLTDATVSFIVIAQSDYMAGNAVSPVISIAGTAAVTSGTALFTVEIPSTATATLAACPPDDQFDYVYQLKATAGAHVITEAIGAMTIRRRVG